MDYKCSEKIRAKAREYYWNNRKTILDYKKKERETLSPKIAIRKKEFYEKNKDQILLKKKKYYLENKEGISSRKKKHYEANKKRILKHNKIWREEHKEEIREKIKKQRPLINAKERIKWTANIPARISRTMKNQIYISLKKRKNGNHWEKIVGYSLEELMNHLKKKFKIGMSWENHGLWHIDHKRPVSSFNFQSFCDQEFKECWALKNLQPLWAKENHIKYNKIMEY